MDAQLYAKNINMLETQERINALAEEIAEARPAGCNYCFRPYAIARNLAMQMENGAVGSIYEASQLLRENLGTNCMRGMAGDERLNPGRAEGCTYDSTISRPNLTPVSVSISSAETLS